MEMTIDTNLLYESGYNKGFKDGIKGSIPKADYEARLKADKMATFKEFRDKLSKWMFHNSESVCGNSMIDIDYLEGYMDELLYELGIYEVENGNDDSREK